MNFVDVSGIHGNHRQEACWPGPGELCDGDHNERDWHLLQLTFLWPNNDLTGTIRDTPGNLMYTIHCQYNPLSIYSYKTKNLDIR